MKIVTRHKLSKLSAFLIVAVIACLACAVSPFILQAQTTAAKTPKQKTFGSSLKERAAADASNQTGAASDDEKPDETTVAASETIKIETLLAVSDVSVTDKSGTRFIEGLGKDDFVVTEDDRPQQIATLTPGDDALRLPRSIVLIIDRSQSQLPYLDASIEAAKRLVNQLARTDEMAIVTDDIQLAADFTKDKKQLKTTLDSLKKLTMNGFHSRSLQFSALLATLRELIDVEKKRPIIIFQTDGDEADRLGGNAFIKRAQPQPKSYNMADVYAAAEKSRVKIYTVIPSDKLIGLSPEETVARVNLMNEKSRRAQEKVPDMWEGHRRLPPLEESSAKSKQNPAAISARDAVIKRAIMERFADYRAEEQEAAAHVAEVTGGFTSFLERPEQAKDIYARILADIEHRYIIGYYPTNKARDGRLRKVHIEVRNHPEYIVHGRESYYVETPR